jgi:hypothetical protein
VLPDLAALGVSLFERVVGTLGYLDTGKFA